MFAKVVDDTRLSVHAVVGVTETSGKLDASNGSCFAVGKGLFMTVAHVCHLQQNMKQPIHQQIFVAIIEDGQSTMIRAKVLDIDDGLDVAILQADWPKQAGFLLIADEVVPVGSNVGYLGFPVANFQIIKKPNSADINLIAVRRFSAGHISSHTHSNGDVESYETDFTIYSGGSGGPLLSLDGKVVGMVVGTLSLASGDASEQTQVEAQRLSISKWLSSRKIAQRFHDKLILT